LFPTASGTFPSKVTVINTIASLASQLGKSITTHSGAPSWGGHAMRRGGAQYLAAAGVDIWRIQALARHSSAAILQYIEKAHVPTLKSIASEAAAGRKHSALAEEVALLRQMINTSLTKPAETAAIIHHAPAKKTVGKKYIYNTSVGGKVHINNPELPGRAKCKWLWAASAQATPGQSAMGPPEDFRPLCTKCVLRDEGHSDDSSVLSTDADDAQA
jgi:hypothetical protein